MPACTKCTRFFTLHHPVRYCADCCTICIPERFILFIFLHSNMFAICVYLMLGVFFVHFYWFPLFFFSRGVAVIMNSVRKSAMSAIWCGTKCGLNYFNISDGFIISVFRCCNDRKITSVRIFMYNLAFLNSWNTVPS